MSFEWIKLMILDQFFFVFYSLINTADLYNPSLVGGTMPKMSMLREHK